MTTILLNQRTFGKQSRKEVKELLPNIASRKMITVNYNKTHLLKDKNGRIIARVTEKSIVTDRSRSNCELFIY